MRHTLGVFATFRSPQPAASPCLKSLHLPPSSRPLLFASHGPRLLPGNLQRRAVGAAWLAGFPVRRARDRAGMGRGGLVAWAGVGGSGRRAGGRMWDSHGVAAVLWDG